MSYGALAYVYDEVTGRGSFAALEHPLETALSLAGAQGGLHVDLACGTALSMPLFQRHGYQSIALDISIPMLRCARHETTRLIRGDLRRLPLRGTFALITSLNDTIRLLTRRTDLIRLFRSVRRLMTARSLYIFNVTTPAATRALMRISEFHYRGASYDITLRSTFSRARRSDRLHFTGRVTAHGVDYAIAETHFQRIYSRREIEEALREAAMTIEAVVDVKAPAGPGVRSWIFVVRRMQPSLGASD